MAPSCCKQQLQTLDLGRKLLVSLTLDSCLWCSVQQSQYPRIQNAIACGGFDPDWQSIQSDRRDTVAILSILVTFKAVLSCRHKASGGANEETMPYIVFFLFLDLYLNLRATVDWIH